MYRILSIGLLACAGLVGCTTQALDKSVVDLQAMESRLATQAQQARADAAQLQAQADALPPDAPGKPAAVKAAASAAATATKAESTHQAVAAGVTQLKDVQATANAPPTAVDPTAGVTIGGVLAGPVGAFLGGALVTGLPLLIKNRTLLAAATSIITSVQQVINANPHVADAFDKNAPTISKVQTPTAKVLVDKVQSDMATDGQMPVVA